MAGEQSRINGRKGGRKKGLATIEREKAKEYIAEQIGKYMPEIFEAMLAKAKTGDIQAIKEMFDRAFGKSVQPLVTKDKDGNDAPIPILGGITRHEDQETDQ